MYNRLKILDIWVDSVSREKAIRFVRTILDNGDRPHSIIAMNPEKNFSVPKDALLYQTVENADLLIPDGIGIVLAARILHGIRLKRLPGSEFIFDICGIAAAENHSVFIFGASEEVSKDAVKRLKKRMPELKIAGRANGFIGEPEMPDLIDRINASNADILFLALGSPKQEKWYANYKDLLRHVRIVQGVGGTLDTIVGKVKRAPDAWCRLHLEWLYRLISEPRRLKRQKVLPLFVWMVLVAKITQIFRGDK